MTAYRFDTELPGLRIEHGDTVAAGAATGPDAPDSFWMNGVGGWTYTEAGAEMADPQGRATACRPVQ